MASVQNQTEQDYEHLFINDNEGNGLHWANAQIHINSHRINGDWVYVLDDDDFLTDMDFIKCLKDIVKSHAPHVIICKGHIGDSLYPHEKIWKSSNVIRGTLGSPNFVVKKELFLKYSHFWDSKKAGDYFFINEVFRYTNPDKVYWLSRIVFSAPVGNCKAEDIGKEYAFYG